MAQLLNTTVEELMGLTENPEKNPQIWNFSESQLAGSGLNVKNIHISDLLMLLCLELGKN